MTKSTIAIAVALVAFTTIGSVNFSTADAQSVLFLNKEVSGSLSVSGTRNCSRGYNRLKRRLTDRAKRHCVRTAGSYGRAISGKRFIKKNCSKSHSPKSVHVSGRLFYGCR